MFWIFAPYLYYQIISYCATTQYGVIIPYMNSDCRRKSFWPPARARRKGVSRGEFRRARAFRRSETEAVSSVQNRFGFGQTNAPELNFQEFCRLIQPREARQRRETLARRARRGSPSAGSKSLAILSICFPQLQINKIIL